MHGPRPQAWQAASRTEEFGLLAERVRSWLSAGLEPHAVGVTARSAALVREAREALEAAGIATASLGGRSHVPAVRTGTMHAMKGLEFQAVAVIGVEQGLVPEPGAVTPETEDPSRTPRTCGGNAASCSSPAPGPGITSTSPAPASRARSCRPARSSRSRPQQRFIRGEINVLSCSTTFELGRPTDPRHGVIAIPNGPFLL